MNCIITLLLHLLCREHDVGHRISRLVKESRPWMEKATLSVQACMLQFPNPESNVMGLVDSLCCTRKSLHISGCWTFNPSQHRIECSTYNSTQSSPWGIR